MSLEPKQVGSWKMLDAQLAFSGTHAALLHTGKVLYWSYDPARENDVRRMLWQLFDPRDGSVTTPAAVHSRNLFCAGHAFLPDGRLFVAGGQSHNPELPPGTNPSVFGVGADHDLHTFDPRTETWQQRGRMPQARYYPTVAPLPSGDALVVSGAWQRTLAENLQHVYAVTDTVELFDASRNVAGPPLRFEAGSEKHLRSLYPFVFALPGRGEEWTLFVFSNAEAKLFYTRRSGVGMPGTWADETFHCDNQATRNYPHQGSAVLLPFFEDDPAVRIMVVGGAGAEHDGHHQLATNIAEVFELPLTEEPHRQAFWRSTRGGRPEFRRFMGDSVLLADGTVMVVNGAASGTADHSHRPVLVPELFDPETESWRLLARANRRRMYHSSAMLLPDGRVLIAGNTEHWNPDNEVEDKSLELFSPPYLFRGLRPRIESAPKELRYGEAFEVEVSHPDAIRKVHLIRMSSTTHTLNTDQRCVRLRVQGVTGSRLQLQAPSRRALALPGYYMLFVVDAQGVPSEARILRLGEAPGAFQEVITRQFTVQEKDREVATGLELQDGDAFDITATGSIYAGIAFTDENGPEGWERVETDPKFPLHTGPYARPFSLIARLEGQPYFYVGRSSGKLTYHDAVSRPLFLRINDDAPGNGHGAFQVTVTVWRR